MKKNRVLTILFLIWKSIEPTTTLASDQLIKSCMAGNITEVKTLIKNGADVNFKDKEGRTALSVAYLWPELCELLINNKADINGGESPCLLNACNRGVVETIRVLLKAGADPNRPVIIKTTGSLEKMISDEKAKGAKANTMMIKSIEDQIGRMNANTVKIYPLFQLIVGSNCVECMQIMMEKGAKVDIVIPMTGGNLLNEFAIAGMSVPDRINANKNQNAYLERTGFTVPELIKNQDPKLIASPDEIVKLLVKSKININNKNTKGETPLNAALGIGGEKRADVILALVNNGADLNIESLEYGSPIVAAAGHGLTNVLTAMLAKGANINKLSKIDDWKKSGNLINNVSPLMWAAKNGKMETIKFLVSKNASFKDLASGSSVNKNTNCIVNFKDKSVIYFAIESANLSVVKYFIETHGKSLLNSVTIEPWKDGAAKGLAWAASVKVSCIAPGVLKPSKYAKDSGNKEIAEYLVSKNH